MTGVVLGNYALSSGSPAINYVSNAASPTSYAAAPALDFFGNPRKANNAVDVGAVEFQAPPAAILSVAPSPLAFGSVVVTTPATTSTLNLTVSNTGTLGATGITVGSLPAGFTRTGGSCGASPFALAATSTCTIAVTFTPTAVQSYGGPLTITGSVTVAGAPVTLSGAGIAAVRTARLAPATWSPIQTRNCPGAACASDPAQVFMLTNTGNVSLTGIGQGALAGTNSSPEVANCQSSKTACE